MGAGQQKKKESAAEKAQKLMLTWLVTYPGIFDTVEKYIQPSDFVVPLYRQVAEMLYQQHRDGDVNPARLMNALLLQVPAVPVYLWDPRFCFSLSDSHP